MYGTPGCLLSGSSCHKGTPARACPTIFARFASRAFVAMSDEVIPPYNKILVMSIYTKNTCARVSLFLFSMTKGFYLHQTNCQYLWKQSNLRHILENVYDTGFNMEKIHEKETARRHPRQTGTSYSIIIKCIIIHYKNVNNYAHRTSYSLE